MNEIRFGKDSFLSNFYECEVEYDGLFYKNAEACFHAQKCDNDEEKKSFCDLKASEAWRCGRDSKKTTLRSDWESVKQPIMKKIVKNKFEHNLELAKRLVETQNDVLKECAGDRIWGVDNSGNGQNLLGKILMEVREELKQSDTLKEYISLQKNYNKRVSSIAFQICDNREIDADASDEEKLAYYILKQRYENLTDFCSTKIKEKYGASDEDVKRLIKNWFMYNDLCEINYIGTDFYSDAMFVKHKVPYLYRSVGRDGENIEWDKDAEYNDYREIVKDIFGKCLEQIKSGGNGELYSYTKCFGRMLYKYTNFQNIDETKKIEIRKNACVNTLSQGGEYDCSFQDFIGRDRGKQGKKKIANLLFSVDMSNVRGNSVSNLKDWFDRYLGKQEYVIRYNDIFDPIGDAEVVCNFTSWTVLEFRNIQCEEVERFELDVNEFCRLLYGYTIRLSKELENEITVLAFVKDSVNSLQNQNDLNDYYRKILEGNESEITKKILENIDWGLEKEYIQRQKSEKKNDEKVPVDVYKEENQELKTGLWKQICIEAVKGNYSHVDCSNL